MAAHPQVVDPRHPLVERVRAICLRYPESTEVEAWGRPSFRAGKKIFVLVGSMSEPLSIMVKPEPDEMPAFRQDDRFWDPPYWAHQGWVATSIENVDWAEAAEWIDTSYRQVALKRQLAELDSRSADPLV